MIKFSRKNKKVAVQISNFDVNERIRIPKMVVIDENGENLGVLNKFDAINIAKERELDLVLVSPNGENPVARIIDYAKFKYEKSKKLRKNKGKAVETKEWWFKPSIDDRDIEMKLEKVKKFIAKGGNAKLTVKYVHKTPFEAMKNTYDRIASRIDEYAKPLGEMAKEGRNLSIIVKRKDKDVVEVKTAEQETVTK